MAERKPLIFLGMRKSFAFDSRDKSIAHSLVSGNKHFDQNVSLPTLIESLNTPWNWVFLDERQNFKSVFCFHVINLFYGQKPFLRLWRLELVLVLTEMSQSKQCISGCVSLINYLFGSICLTYFCAEKFCRSFTYHLLQSPKIVLRN